MQTLDYSSMVERCRLQYLLWPNTHAFVGCQSCCAPRGVLVHISGIFWRWEDEEGWRILLIGCFCFRFCGGCYHGASLASIPSMWVECDVGSAARRGGENEAVYLFYLDQNRNTLWLVIWSSLLPTASWAWEEVWSLSLIQHLQFHHPRNLRLAITSSS